MRGEIEVEVLAPGLPGGIENAGEVFDAVTSADWPIGDQREVIPLKYPEAGPSGRGRQRRDRRLISGPRVAGRADDKERCKEKWSNPHGVECRPGPTGEEFWLTEEDQEDKLENLSHLKPP